MIAAGTSPTTGAAVGGAVSKGGGLSENDGRALVGDGVAVGAESGDLAGLDDAEAQATRAGSRARRRSERRITGASIISGVCHDRDDPAARPVPPAIAVSG
jgi:hypothetical protein